MMLLPWLNLQRTKAFSTLLPRKPQPMLLSPVLHTSPLVTFWLAREPELLVPWVLAPMVKSWLSVRLATLSGLMTLLVM